MRILEAIAPKVGRKYQHIEDLILSHGSHGGLHAVQRLHNMAEQGGTIELKWDGMPVVYWGRDEEGNFGMIPKNAWAYLKSGKTQTASGASTIMRDPKDVKLFVLGTGGGDPAAREAFANQFASLWPYFEQISPKKGYLEGGLLFYPGTKPDGASAMPVLTKETNTYDFTPNITTFHVPADSELGKKISKAKVMVAATGYFQTLGSADEQRFPNAESLSTPDVIVQGTTYVQNPVKVDQEGLKNLANFIKTNAKKIDDFLAPKPGMNNPGAELYSYLNKHLRTEGLVNDFPSWAKSNLSTKKAETLLADKEGLKATLGAIESLGIHKQLLIDELSQGLHGGIRQTKPEGYAQSHPGARFDNDIPGQFIKTIDQKNWSPKESAMNNGTAITEDQAQGKSAVLGWGRGMGHTGHDALVIAVLHQAAVSNSTPFFIVSRSFGKDDPIPPDMKLAMYQKKFPKHADMFSLPTADKPSLNDVLADLATKGFTDITLVVGADQKEAFGYLTRPDKSGTEPYKKFGLNSLTIMSRQDTKAPGSDTESPNYHEGPRATPMREVLLDPDKTEEEQFAVWRQAISPKLNDKEVLHMMNTAKTNLTQFHAAKPKGRKLKEFIQRIQPLIVSESTPYNVKIRLISMFNQASKQLNEEKKPEFMKTGNMKPFTASGKEKPGAVEMLERALLKAKERGTKLNYENIDKMMQLVSKKHNLTGDKLHKDFVKKHHMIPDNWVKKQEIKSRTSNNPKGIAESTRKPTHKNHRDMTIVSDLGDNYYLSADKQEDDDKRWVDYAVWTKVPDADDMYTFVNFVNVSSRATREIFDSKIKEIIAADKAENNVSESYDYLEEK